jgi:hypothetical protein
MMLRLWRCFTLILTEFEGDEIIGIVFDVIGWWPAPFADANCLGTT